MMNLLFTCSDDVFKEIVVAFIRHYSRKTHMRVKEVWEMMFGKGTKFNDLLDDRIEVAYCLSALMESLTC